MSPFSLVTSIIDRLFKKGHQRTVNARKNIFASFLIKGGSIVVSFLFVPLTISYINPTHYGIWVTLSSVVGWFTFFDIGFGNGLRNKFAEAVARNQPQLARIYISTTYAVLSLIIIIVLILVLIVNPFLNWATILNAPEGMRAELGTLALIVFVFFSIQFVFQLINIVLTASQKPARAALFSLLGSLLALIIIFILSKTTQGDLLLLGVTMGVSPVIVMIIASIWLYIGKYKEYAPAIRFVKFRYAKNLMGLGVKFFIIQIASIILYQTSIIIIAHIAGPEKVTSYNIAYKYFSIIPMAFSIIMTPYWSAFTDAWVKNEIGWIHKTMNNLVRGWMIISGIALVMLIGSGMFYKLWVGDTITVSNSISIVLAFYVVINAWCSIFSQFLNGVGKIKLQLYSGLIGALINIPLAIYLGKTLGVYGVILSTCFISLGSAIWSPIQYYKLINKKATGIWNQ